MSEQNSGNRPQGELRESLSWMPGGEIRGCPACRRVILSPSQAQDPLCPLCYQAELVAQAGLVRLQPPEIYLPAALGDARIMEILNAFADGVPHKVDDLDANKLRSRLRLVWWPQWLLDGDLEGKWSGTFGFDYQVKTAQESYGDAGWQSREKVRTETRYLPRVGEISRHYDNLIVPALREQNLRFEQIGAYENKKAVLFEQNAVQNSYIQMPEIDPQELLENAQNRLREKGVEDIVRAAAADHRREVNFEGQFNNLNWTEFLQPIYTTFYVDDQGKRQVVALNGQSGKIYGRRMASVEKAKKLSLLLAIVPAIVTLVAILISVFSLNPGMVFVALFGIFFLGLAFIPYVRASIWNSEQNRGKKDFR